MGSRQVYWVAAFLMLTGLGLFLYKVVDLGFPILPGEKSDHWEIEAQVRFTAQDKPVKVALYIPRSTRRFAVEDESFISRGYGLTTALVDGDRLAVWAVRKASGRQALYYRSMVQDLAATAEELAAPAPKLDEEVPFQEAALAAAQSLLAEAREKSADTDTLVKEVLKRLAEPKPDNTLAILLGPRPNATRITETAVRVLAMAKIPARMLRGVRLASAEAASGIVPWLQVHTEGKWIGYDPMSRTTGLPADLLVFARGHKPVLDTSGVRGAELTVTVRRSEAEGLEAATNRGRALNPHLLEFSLLNLPVKTQLVYQVLIMVPIGAFLLILMRSIVGVKTFGTFMPVLIGLAFRETQLVWGVVLFSAVVALGLAVRFYFERLKLLLVPRLAAVLIVVVLLMAMLSIVSHQLGLERGLSVALFPMVILTMTIERMSIVWEERGAGEALQQGLGSLLVAALTYLAMSDVYLQHLMFVFPELLLVLLAASLLLGRYTGYRLVELRRFRALAKPPSA